MSYLAISSTLKRRGEFIRVTHNIKKQDSYYPSCHTLKYYPVNVRERYQGSNHIRVHGSFTDLSRHFWFSFFTYNGDVACFKSQRWNNYKMQLTLVTAIRMSEKPLCILQKNFQESWLILYHCDFNCIVFQWFHSLLLKILQPTQKNISTWRVCVSLFTYLFLLDISCTLIYLIYIPPSGAQSGLHTIHSSHFSELQ